MYFFLSKILAPLINLTNLILFICIISYFLKKFFFKNFFKIISYIGIFFLILFSLFPIGKKLTNTIEKEYISTVLPANYDYIVVLAGGEETYTTFITNKLHLNSASERLIASVRLANKKKDSKIIYLGGSGLLRNNNSNENEANVAKLFFKDINFDLKRVIFIDNTRNTVENLKAFKKINTFNQSNILITSAFHMKRSMLIAKKLDLNIKPFGVDFRSVNNFNILNYYQRLSIAENWQSFNIFFREIIGILAFKLLK